MNDLDYDGQGRMNPGSTTIIDGVLLDAAVELAEAGQHTVMELEIVRRAFGAIDITGHSNFEIASAFVRLYRSGTINVFVEPVVLRTLQRTPKRIAPAPAIERMSARHCKPAREID